ncbi:unnamed protein product, partial [Owenia fusiformis]
GNFATKDEKPRTKCSTIEKMQTQTKEEKVLESSVEAILQRVQEVKSGIVAFLLKLEHEHQTLNWPSMLDSYALLSGQMNSLQKLLKSDKMPNLRNQIVLPLALVPERDPEVEKITEGRVMAFNHEVVPDYLRTKPLPGADEKQLQISTKTGMPPQDIIQKQVANLNKISSNLVELITSSREEWESEQNTKSQLPQTTSQDDTHSLIGATNFGKGLKQMERRRMTGGPQGPPQQQSQQPPPAPAPTINVNKAPSAIKTNIKAASSSHPYSRS